MPGFPAMLDLSRLNGKNGFHLKGSGDNLLSGRVGGSVSSAGDVNGDGFDDVIISAANARVHGDKSSGSSFVLFGRAGGFAATVELSSLNGHNGFRLDGSGLDRSGWSVSSAGDVNGDGFDDIIVGTSDISSSYNGEPPKPFGSTYIVFGHAGGFSRALDLSSLDARDGFHLVAPTKHDETGFSVSSAGDVNGDGFDDVIVGAPSGNKNDQASVGFSYVVFGHAGGFSRKLDLSGLDGENGFRLDGALDTGIFGGGSGFSVSSAGDVNGDGFADLVVGAPYMDRGGRFSGASYVVFGHEGGFPPRLNLSALDGENGFRLHGAGARTFSGYSVSSAGDVNGDGLADIVVGAPSNIDPDFRIAGTSYVVFGRKGGFSPSLDLSSLDGRNGFRLDGVKNDDSSGASVSSAGDVNGDGFDDIIIGAPSGGSVSSSYGSGTDGASYVVFGHAGHFRPSLDLSSLDGSNGFRIGGLYEYSSAGRSVSSAGDVNGDGFDDIIIGAPNFGSNSGYVIFGRAPDTAVTRKGTGADNVISGGAFGDTLNGLGGDDILRGNDGRDTLYGGAGDDVLKGGGGRDLLKGFAGRDTFVFDEAATAHNLDHIMDFRAVDDRIRLDDAVFRSLDRGGLDADAFRLIGGPNAKVGADDHVLYDRDTGSLFYDANGGDAGQRHQFAVLDNHAALTSADFLIV